MKATFVVTVDLDVDSVSIHARHRRKPIEVAKREFLGLIRFVDGVVPPIRIEVLADSPRVTTG